ncbi:MAG: hypothetical protein C5B48_15990 [Candidatus Rokuibacteriota bacterium]|nr:MAG: hypothetical protein C5B48_15990 [Candidatus Rokubacteria bacterium]
MAGAGRLRPAQPPSDPHEERGRRAAGGKLGGGHRGLRRDLHRDPDRLGRTLGRVGRSVPREVPGVSQSGGGEPFDLGERAPDFGPLLAVDGSRYSLASFASADVLAIVFSCNGCPTVRAAEDGLVAHQAAYASRGAQLLAINANNPFLSPRDTYAEMVKRAGEKSFNFPYLKDEDGSAARRYGANRTPHVFVLDHGRKLRYRGRIADSRDPDKVTRHDLERAVDDLLASRAVEVPETEPFGCAIVW